jgi:putative NADH-flavin reductase
MNLVIFGATGPTGRQLVEQARVAGHAVTAAARRPGRFGDSGVRADVTDLATVEAAVKGADAVVSAIGAAITRKPITVYSQAAVNLATAMHRHGVKRLVAISSSAVDPHWRPSGAHLFNWVLDPLVNRVVARTAHTDMRRMEATLRDSDLDWTVVRPSGLFDHPVITRYQVAEDSADGLFTARSDLAAAVLAQLTDDRFIRKAIGVITTDVRPSLARVLFREMTRAR